MGTSGGGMGGHGSRDHYADYGTGDPYADYGSDGDPYDDGADRSAVGAAPSWAGTGGTSWPAQGPDAHRSGSSGAETSAEPIDPYAIGGDVLDPHPSSTDSLDPYRSDPLAADGFGDGFGVAPSAPAQYGAPQFGQTAAAQWPAGQAPLGPPPQWAHGAMYRPSSSMAIAGFAISLASFLMCGGLLSPIALVFSLLGMKETNPSSPTARSGRGLAITGLILSILGTLMVLFYVIYIVFVVVLAGWSASG